MVARMKILERKDFMPQGTLQPRQTVNVDTVDTAVDTKGKEV